MGDYSKFNTEVLKDKFSEYNQDIINITRGNSFETYCKCNSLRKIWAELNNRNIDPKFDNGKNYKMKQLNSHSQNFCI